MVGILTKFYKKNYLSFDKTIIFPPVTCKLYIFLTTSANFYGLVLRHFLIRSISSSIMTRRCPLRS